MIVVKAAHLCLSSVTILLHLLLQNLPHLLHLHLLILQNLYHPCLISSSSLVAVLCHPQMVVWAPQDLRSMESDERRDTMYTPLSPPHPQSLASSAMVSPVMSRTLQGPDHRAKPTPTEISPTLPVHTPPNPSTYSAFA